MNRLTLDQFKKKTEVSKEKMKELEKTRDLEKLTGGILARCHCPDFEWPIKYPW